MKKRKVGRKSSQKSSAKAIARADRAAKAVKLRVAGYTLEEIAQKLGIPTRSTVHTLIVDSIASTVNKEEVDHLRDLMQSRIEEAHKAIWPAVLRGCPKALDGFVKLAARQAKLFGLDAPAQIQATVSTGPAPEQLDAIRKLISDPRGRELLLAQDRLLAELDAREKANAVNPPIDVECVECTSLAVVDSVPDLSSEPIAVDDPNDSV